MSEQMANTRGEVRATRLVLVDDNGRERAVLQMVDGEPVFRLNDERGKERVTLRLKNGDPYVDLTDKNGIPGVYLYVVSDHSSYLGIIGPSGSPISLWAPKLMPGIRPLQRFP
jgi:hypothetical protein